MESDGSEGEAAVLSSDLTPRVGSLPGVCGAALAVDQGLKVTEQ